MKQIIPLSITPFNLMNHWYGFDYNVQIESNRLSFNSIWSSWGFEYNIREVDNTQKGILLYSFTTGIYKVDFKMNKKMHSRFSYV